MNVVDAMAGHAFPGQILVTLIGVAAIAGSFLVFAVQRKFGFVMIESAGFPRLDAMALVAFLA